MLLVGTNLRNLFYKISIPVHFGSEKIVKIYFFLVLAYFLIFLIFFLVQNLLLWSIKPYVVLALGFVWLDW